MKVYCVSITFLLALERNRKTLECLLVTSLRFEVQDEGRDDIGGQRSSVSSSTDISTSRRMARN